MAPIQLGGKVDPKGLNNPSNPWYIVNGIAGHYDGRDTLASPRVNQSVFGLDSVYGWSRYTVNSCSSLTTEFIASGSGKVLDTATLFKDRKCHEIESDD
jgi:acid phosphatase type 7